MEPQTKSQYVQGGQKCARGIILIDFVIFEELPNCANFSENEGGIILTFMVYEENLDCASLGKKYLNPTNISEN